MKKYILKNKKIIIFIIVGVIILICCFVLIAIGILKKDNPNQKVNQNNKLTNAEIEKLITNNYLYSYLMQGDVKVGETYAENNDKKYYIVVDELLKDITSIEDINELIENTFTSYRIPTCYTEINESKNNEYLEINDMLYVYKKNVCENFPKLEINNLIQTEVEDGIWIDYDYIGFKLENEDNLWKTGVIIYSCE